MHGAPPRPDEAPAQRRRERRWLPALGVVAVIVVVTGGGRVVGGAVAGAAEPVVLAGSVTVTPEPGWAVVSTGEQEGLSQALLAHGNANLLIVAGPAGAGTAQELARSYVEVLEDRFAQVTTGEASIEGGERVRFGYVGITSDGVAVEGVVAAVADPVTGAGAVFDGFAPKGSLGAAIEDVATMIDTAEVG